MRNIGSLIIGILFGIGLIISEMVNPTKVLSFLNILGGWDPSLGFVMFGAVLVTALGYRMLRKLSKPLLDTSFQFPTNNTIDFKLVLGAILFGAGWGIAGLCPGPAITSLTFGSNTAYVFISAMIAGIVCFEILNKLKN